MSIAVMNWVWCCSPTSGNQRLVLLALADACSRDDGTGCWPSVATVARKANITARTVRRILAELEAAGHLKVNRGAGPRGTNGYAIILRTPVDNPAPPVDNTPDSVDNTVDNPADPGQGVTPDTLSGVTQVTARGDTGVRGGVTRVSPDPPKNHQEPPPPPRARPRPRPRPAGRPEGGGGDPEPGTPQQTRTPIEVFIAALGPGWPLSARQIDRLTPAITAALTGGWTPAALARHVGANTTGVRSPFAVLTARLADLPDPAHLPPPQTGPADRTLTEILTTATCPHGDPRPRGCALCRRGITHQENT